MKWKSLLFSHFLLALVVALLLAVPTPAIAQFSEVNDVEFDQSRRYYDRRQRLYFTLNKIQNTANSEVKGPFRLVVTNATLTVLNADGNTDAGEPFIALPAIGTLSAGASSGEVRIEFARRRVALSYGLRLERQSAVENLPPLANAGRDQTVATGTRVELDGSGSSDPEGQPLTYSWTLLEVPFNSGATLDNPLVVNPAFFIDMPGEYRVRLVVSDGIFDSAEDIVIVSTFNSPPVADAGPDQTVAVGSEAVLDASGTTDVDGPPIGFSWRFTERPDGSSAALSDPAGVITGFIVDRPGPYTIELTVSDGEFEDRDNVIVRTSNSPPVANAGDDQTTPVNNSVLLSALASSDPEGDALTYRWTLISAPQGSNASPTDPTGISTAINIDRSGEYVIQLIVSDGEFSSAPDTVRISTVNSRPMALAETDPEGRVGNEQLLNGANSRDPDGDILQYTWMLIVSPEGSQALLIDEDAAVARFTPDLAGRYVAQLIVADGMLASEPVTVSIDVLPVADSFPVITSLPSLIAEIDTPYSYAISAFDPDGGTISYELLTAPTGMLLNAETAQVEWTPAVAGQASVRLQVTDNEGNSVEQAFTIDVTAGEGNRAPQLAPVGNHTAVLGQTLTLQLSALEPDEAQLTSFHVNPVPLPANMRFDAVSGVFSFTPTLEQVGSFELVFFATDGRFSTQESITITVPPPDGVTRLAGQVITTDGAPLANVRLEMGGVETLSDASGNYQLSGIPISGRARLLIDGSTVEPALGVFATVPEVITVIQGANNRLEPPIVLLPLDVAAADPVNPAATSIISSSRLTAGLEIFEPVRMTIPPGMAIWDETGELFDGDIHISFITDPTQGPRPLPPNFDLGVYIAIQPFGVTYREPVPISFPNLEGFPPGSRLDFFALNHETGVMEKIGEGLVSANGKTVDSIGGVVRSNSWHGIVPQEPVTMPDEDNGSKNPDDNCCPKPCNTASQACSIDRSTGELTEEHALPSYTSLGRTRSVVFKYNSDGADPRPILGLSSTFGNQAPPPEAMSTQAFIGGVAFTPEVFADINIVPSSIRGQFKDTRAALQFDAHALGTAIYDYDLVVNCYFPISRRSGTTRSSQIIRNDINSPFGAGWTLIGLQEAKTTDSGLVLITEGDGQSWRFRPDGNGGFISPAADFSVLRRDTEGRLTRTMKNGDQYIFQLGDQPPLGDASGTTGGSGSTTPSNAILSAAAYIPPAQLMAMVDRNGNRTEFNFDSRRRLRSIVDPVGKSYQFDYSETLLRSVTDPDGRTTRFRHDSNGNLIRITEPNGDIRQFEYEFEAEPVVRIADSGFETVGTQRASVAVAVQVGPPGLHLMTAQIDQRGNRKQYFYDQRGKRIERAVLADGSEILLEPKVQKGLPSRALVLGSSRTNRAPKPPLQENVNNVFIDANGNRTVAKTDSRNFNTTFTDAVGRTTVYGRDGDSNPASTTRPNGSRITRSYDDRGNVLTQRESFNGATWRYTYDAFSLPLTITNPRGHTTTILRDGEGNASHVINHLGHITFMEYDGRGLVTRMQTPNGLVSELNYNSAGLVERITQTPPVGTPGNVRVSRFEYDAVGQATEVQTPDGVIININYDSKGRITRIRDNLNQTVEYEYDGYNNVVRTDVRNSNGNLALTTQQTFDERNRLIDMSQPHTSGQSMTDYRYDGNSNITRLVDPNRNGSSSDFDGADRQIRHTHRLNGVSQFDYDTNDRVTKVVAPNGATTTYTYDVLGRRLTENSPDRGLLRYEYDLANNLTSVTDARGITKQMSYDELERLSTVTYPNTIPGKNENIVYTYDNCELGIGRLCQRTDESGIWNYRYDAWGNIVSEARNELGVDYITQYEYDNGNNVIGMVYPSGRVVRFQRDSVRRIEAIEAEINGANQTIVSGIEYRADNQLTASTFGNGLEDSRTYDLQGRLLHQRLAAPGEAPVDERTYNYDANSNMLERLTTPQNSRYHYDKLDRLTGDGIDSDPVIDYDYDQNDNRQNRTQTGVVGERYSYESGSNRLLETVAEFDGAPDSPSRGDQALLYNNVGRLYRVERGGVPIAEYVYNAEGQRTRKDLLAADGSVDRVVVFHYDLSGYLIAETNSGGGAVRDYIWTDNMVPVAQVDIAAALDRLTYLHVDHLMTPRFGTDSAQAVVWRWEGKVFGESNAGDVAGSGVEINLRFPGQYLDNKLMAIQNWERYYFPIVGRYSRFDPIGIDIDYSAYAYAGNNPLRYIDPTGESKGGKKNINTGGFNQNSDPKDIENEMKNAKSKAYKKALRGLLKVAKRIQKFKSSFFIMFDPCLYGIDCGTACPLNDNYI